MFFNLLLLQLKQFHNVTRTEPPVTIRPASDKKSGKFPGLIQSLIMSNTRLPREHSRVDHWGFYWHRKIKTWGSLPTEIPSLGSLCQEKVQVLGHSVQSATKTWWPLSRQDTRLGIYFGRKDPRLDFFWTESQNGAFSRFIGTFNISFVYTNVQTKHQLWLWMLFKLCSCFLVRYGHLFKAKKLLKNTNSILNVEEKWGAIAKKTTSILNITNIHKTTSQSKKNELDFKNIRKQEFVVTLDMNNCFTSLKNICISKTVFAKQRKFVWKYNFFPKQARSKILSDVDPSDIGEPNHCSTLTMIFSILIFSMVFLN